MRILLIALALCAPAFAEEAVPFNASQLPGPYWFRVYSTAPYLEIWSAEISVKDFDKDEAKIVAAVEKNGGALTAPLSAFIASRTEHSQQIVFSVPGKKTKAVIKALRKVGEMADPSITPQGSRIPLAEVRAKIDTLMKEKTQHAAELAKVPAAAAAEEEILEHLLLVEEVGKRPDVDVRLNLLVKQK